MQEPDLTVSELKLSAVRRSAVMAEEISLKIRGSELWQAVSGWRMYISKLNLKWNDKPMNRPISLSSMA